jgi:uncharacterized protein (DUF1810 family)
MPLERFIQAQETSFEGALSELKAGRKSGHWIWWVFPQLKGLGSSHNSTFYGLDDEAEARAYLRHPLLGARYRECVSVVHEQLCLRKVEPHALMGSDVDVLKLHSSLQLFLKVACDDDAKLQVQARDILLALRKG